MKKNLLLVLFAFVASSYALVTPLWEAPDEPSHFLYIRHITEHWRPPQAFVTRGGRFYENDNIISLYEWHHPPLYYALGASILAAGQGVSAKIVPEVFPPVNPLVPTAPSPHLFLPDSLSPLKKPLDHSGPLILRLFSIALAIGTVATAYKLARLTLQEYPSFALAVAGLTAFTPQFTHISASINNDNLANLMSVICIWLLLRTLLTQSTAGLDRPFICLGGLLGLALLTKLTLIFLLPLAGAVWLVVAGRHRSIRLAIRHAALGLLPIIVLVGTYIAAFPEARLALEHNSQTLRINPDFVSWSYLQRILDLLPSTFWGRFGWASLPISASLIRVLNTLLVGGLVATAVSILGDLRHRTRRPRAISVALFILAAVVLNVAGFLRFNLTIYQPQGRLLFPTLAPLFILALLGIWHFTPARWRNWLAVVLVFGMVSVNIYALTQVLYPGYYHSILASAFQNTSIVPVGEIRGTVTHGQSFVALYRNLNRIDVLLATYARTNHHPVVFHLKRANDSPTDLVTLEIDAASVIDNAYHSFVFEPIANSEGQSFYFYLESPESVPNDAFTIWATPDDIYQSGTRYKDHLPTDGDLRFIAYSAP